MCDKSLRYIYIYQVVPKLQMRQRAVWETKREYAHLVQIFENLISTICATLPLISEYPPLQEALLFTRSSQIVETTDILLYMYQ